MASRTVGEQVWVDGKLCTFEKGQSILDILGAAGVLLPTLCYDPRLSPQGTCRLCMVQVEGQPGLVAACTTPAQAGMRIATNNETLQNYRKTLLELLLAETPPAQECPHCSAMGPCALHRAATRYVAQEGRFPRLRPRQPSQDSNPFIQRDYRWCIACYRCTRICNEWEMAHAISPFWRGQGTQIASFPDDRLLESPCTFCGQCINTCPTGALTDRKVVQQIGTGAITRVRTICPYCGTGCGIQLLVQGSHLVGVEPDFDNRVNQGSLCVKGQFAAWEFVRSGDRLTTPLLRRNGSFQQVSWEEAYGLITSRLSEIRDAYGPDAIALWSSARATNEANYLMQKLARVVVGTNNIDNCARIDMPQPSPVWRSW